jgi:LCP family protein required for cell wall assembly
MSEMRTEGSGQGSGVEDDDRDDPLAGQQPEAPRRRRRGLRIVIVGLVTLVVVAVGAVAGYLAYLNHTVSTNLTHEPLLPDPSTPIEVEDGEITPSAPARVEAAGTAMNFLVIGSDSRDLNAERGRSDVIVLVHISDDRESVHLVHFPRDLFVPIPGYSRNNKINAAYSYGGAPLLVETVQPLIGVPIDHVAIVNFESFKAMTDAIGGVDVTVAQASTGFPEGVMTMDGATGLEFVRERKELSQGDISRGERQQAFIKAIMLKALSSETLTNPARLASFVDAATTNLVVDEELKVGDMRDLAFAMRGVRGDDITFVTAPWRGIASDPVSGSIVVMNEEQMAVLAEHLQADTMDEYVDDVSPRHGFG